MFLQVFKYFYKLLENEKSSHEFSRDITTLRDSLKMRYKH